MINIPRKSRKDERASIFHVITQGLNKEYIFNEDNEKEFYKKLLIKYARKLDIKILSYCIMSNHMHMLVYVNNVNNMSKMMHKANLIYSNYYNEKYDRVGYVFRDRFLSEGIYTRRQLYNCILYIHKNPVKAKIANNMSEYKYSSYSEFVNGAKNIDIELVREIMGEINIEEVKKNKDEVNFKDVKQNIEKTDAIIENFCRERNINREYLKEYPKLEIDIAKYLVIDKNKSIREVSKYLNINRETLRKKLKKCCQENRPPDN